MHDNFYFLKQLSRALAQKLQVPWKLGLKGYEEIPDTSGSPFQLLACFSQSKDELVLGLGKPGEDLYIRALVSNELSGLSFNAEFHRAKRNSINLFEPLIGKEVQGLVQHLNERSFLLCFEDDLDLLFKLHGRQSNLVLFAQNQFVSGFHKRMDQDQALEPEHLDRDLDQSREAWEASEANLRKLFPTLSKEMRKYLLDQDLASHSRDAQWDILQDFLDEIQSPPYYLLPERQPPLLSLLDPHKLALKPEEIQEMQRLEDPLEASSVFIWAFHRRNQLGKEKKEALKILQRKIKQSYNYIDKTLNRLAQLEDSSYNEETANILMANLHQIPDGHNKVELYDFYKEQTREIKLKKDLSPQKNAENYYRKAKNEKIEIETLQKNIERKEKELGAWEKHKQVIEHIEQLKELRKYLKAHGLEKTTASQEADSFPFKRFEYQGFAIWVGKNAKNNDLLTQQYAHKEDLWLHAKDVSGSHVVIKRQSGKVFPHDVIEKAASLAAYYSKRSHDSLCPVIYTPKKFVRKTKDLAPGQVLVDKEEVIMVVPEKF